jgi:hypothetical protein
LTINGGGAVKGAKLFKRQLRVPVHTKKVIARFRQQNAVSNPSIFNLALMAPSKKRDCFWRTTFSYT